MNLFNCFVSHNTVIDWLLQKKWRISHLSLNIYIKACFNSGRNRKFLALTDRDKFTLLSGISHTWRFCYKNSPRNQEARNLLFILKFVPILNHPTMALPNSGWAVTCYKINIYNVIKRTLKQNKVSIYFKIFMILLSVHYSWCAPWESCLKSNYPIIHYDNTKLYYLRFTSVYERYWWIIQLRVMYQFPVKRSEIWRNWSK